MAALSLLDFLHALGYEQDIVKSIAQQLKYATAACKDFEQREAIVVLTRLSSRICDMADPFCERNVRAIR